MTPDVYEREFHLPAGHAASFGGGPLAALRNRDPELTRYETAVPGLYLTGRGDVPRRRHLGRQRAQLRHRRARRRSHPDPAGMRRRLGVDSAGHGMHTMLTGSIPLGRLAGPR